MSFASRWRRELAVAVACGAAFALPSIGGQWVLARAVGRARELATMLTLGSSSSLHMVLQPVDAVVSAGARIAILGLLCHLVLVVLVGARDWRGTVGALSNASRVLAWAPVVAVALAGCAFLMLRADGADRFGLAYSFGRGWLALQAGLWLWTLARFTSRLQSEHELPRAVAWFVGLAPAWALGLTTLIEAALP
jgi:hypothetical protein